MGMFDYVIYPETKCRTCETSVTEYQSKAGECELQHLTPQQLLAQSDDEVTVFYGYCDLDWNKKPYPHDNHFIVTENGVKEAPQLEDNTNRVPDAKEEKYMASQAQIQAAKIKAYESNPTYDPAVLAEMKRLHQYANTIDPDLVNEASKILNA